MRITTLGLSIVSLLAACSPADQGPNGPGGSTSATGDGDGDGDVGSGGSGNQTSSGGSSNPGSGGSFNPSSGGGPNGTGSTGSGTGGGDSGGSSNPGSGGSSNPGASGGMTGSGGAPPEPWQGEKYPFPQNVNYPHGVASNQVSNDFIRDWYDNYSQKYLQACGGGLRPGVDPLSESLVEAVGFAMIAAAYMGDRATVDALYGFYQSKIANCGLMAWEVNCNGILDSGSATDGDIDTASGLVVAHWQWPDAGYDDKARTVINSIEQMILDCGGTKTLYPGCGGNGAKWGGCGTTDISYYSPAFFRYFAEFTGKPIWNELADDSHLIRDSGANGTTGLVPDWQSTSGGPPSDGSRKHYYSFDAVRTPFKHGLDYLWNGTESAGNWCRKLTSWAHDSVGVENLVDGYQLNGTPEGSYHNMVVVGGMAVCSLANTQEIADAFVAESATMVDDFWYGGYLGNLYLLAMSGNMWNPDLVE